MTSEVETKFIQTIQTMLAELSHEQSSEVEGLIKIMQDYLKELGRFHSSDVFGDMFKTFLEARDRSVGLAHDLDRQGFTKEAERYQEAINHILDQVLNLLSSGLEGSEDITDGLKMIMKKVEKAKSINNIRALSEAFLQAGNSLVNRAEKFENGLTNLTRELTHCRMQIHTLENQLEATKDKAEKDHLTALGNRRAFDRDLTEAVKRAHRFHDSLCLFLVDLDHFKSINDTHGHQVGDEVLINFGKLLANSLRDFDLTFRIGGDEFAVIFTNCDMKLARTVSDRVCKFLAGHQYSSGTDQPFTLTISGGLADLQEKEKPEMLFKRADAKLYEAKHGGRNRVCH